VGRSWLKVAALLPSKIGGVRAVRPLFRLPLQSGGRELCAVGGGRRNYVFEEVDAVLMLKEQPILPVDRGIARIRDNVQPRLGIPILDAKGTALMGNQVFTSRKRLVSDRKVKRHFGFHECNALRMQAGHRWNNGCGRKEKCNETEVFHVLLLFLIHGASAARASLQNAWQPAKHCSRLCNRELEQKGDTSLGVARTICIFSGQELLSWFHK
jgi:hypothetical protein